MAPHAQRWSLGNDSRSAFWPALLLGKQASCNASHFHLSARIHSAEGITVGLVKPANRECRSKVSFTLHDVGRYKLEVLLTWYTEGGCLAR